MCRILQERNIAVTKIEVMEEAKDDGDPGPSRCPDSSQNFTPLQDIMCHVIRRYADFHLNYIKKILKNTQV